MGNSIQFDSDQLSGAIGSMASAYQPLETKFESLKEVADTLTPAWKTPEGVAVIQQYENITTGIADFKTSYGSLTSFLSKSVKISYDAIEQELAAALQGQNAGGN